MHRLLALLLLLACATAQGAATRYAPAQQRALIQSRAVDVRQAALNDLLQRDDSPGLLAFAGKLIADTELAPLQSEYLLDAWLLALRRATPDLALRAEVQALTGYQAKALGPTPEPHSADDAWIPVFDIASQARGTLRAWEFDEHIALARRSLATGDIDGLPISDAEALAHAIAAAPQSQLQALRGSDASLPAPAAAALARRLKDPSLYRALFTRPADAFVVSALTDAAVLLPPDQARELLATAGARPELASAATLALAALQPSNSELFDCLGEASRGGSCAQLLARQADAATLDALAELASAGRDDIATRRALLALLWARSPRGGELLRRYADNTAMPAALRQMVSAWLR